MFVLQVKIKVFFIRLKKIIIIINKKKKKKKNIKSDQVWIAKIT